MRRALVVTIEDFGREDPLMALRLSEVGLMLLDKGERAEAPVQLERRPPVPATRVAWGARSRNSWTSEVRWKTLSSAVRGSWHSKPLRAMRREPRTAEPARPGRGSIQLEERP